MDVAILATQLAPPIGQIVLSVLPEATQFIKCLTTVQKSILIGSTQLYKLIYNQ